MYVYFDTQGVIREIISVDPARVGSSANKIYIYFENNPAIDHLWWVMKKPDDTITTEADIVLNRDLKPLPYDIVKNRDLKYFKDYETYNFYVLTLSSSDLNVNGLAELTLRADIDDVLYAQGLLTFNIESSVVKYDNNITQSQYDYLLTQFGNINDIGVVKKAIGNNIVSLTDDEMQELNKDFAIIIDETTPKTIYVKQKVDSYYIYFSRIHKQNYSGYAGQYADIVEGTMTVSLANKTVVRNTNTTTVYDKEEVDYFLSEKQDTLVNQSNIKSINNNSLLGSGNLHLEDIGYFEISVNDTELTDEQFAQVQKNFCVVCIWLDEDNYEYYYKYSYSDSGDAYIFRPITKLIYNPWAYSLKTEYVYFGIDKSITFNDNTVEFYTKSQTDALIGGLSNLSLKREIVASLPVSDISTNTIYMVLDNAGQGANVYNEYLYINGNWELIGTSKQDYKLYDLGSTLTGRSDIIAQLSQATSQCVLKYTYNYNERFYYERFRHPATPYTLYFESLDVGQNGITKYVLSNESQSSFAHNVHEYPYLQGLVENWSYNTSYVVGDLVCRSGKIYKCNTNHTSTYTPTENTYWDETDLETLLTDIIDFRALDGSRVFYDGITKITDNVNKVWSLKYNDRYYYRARAYDSGLKVNYFTNYEINYDSDDIKEITVRTLSANNQSNTFSYSEKVIYNYLHGLIAHFDTTATYNVNDIVNYGGKVYVCHTAITTAGSWTGAANWTETNLTDLLNAKQNKLYRHQVRGKNSAQTIEWNMTVVSNKSTAYTYATLWDDLYDLRLMFMGGYLEDNDSNYFMITGITNAYNLYDAEAIAFTLVDVATYTQLSVLSMELPVNADTFEDNVSEL